jgi:hypothetical protein
MSDCLQAINANLRRNARLNVVTSNIDNKEGNSMEQTEGEGRSETTGNDKSQGRQTTPLHLQNRANQLNAELEKKRAVIARRIGAAADPAQESQFPGERTVQQQRRESHAKKKAKQHHGIHRK